MGIIEIGLTIWAWHRGWRGWSLLPMASGLAAAFVIGFIIGFSGAVDPEYSDLGGFIIIDIIIISVLIFMLVKPRKKLAVSPGYVPSSSYSIDRYLENKSVYIAPAALIKPITVKYPATRAKLVLADNSEIALTGVINPIGRDNLEKAVPAGALNYISRQHLWIRFNGSQYFAEDANSANGSRINGIEIKGKGLQELKDGDRIDLGGATELTFKLAA